MPVPWKVPTAAQALGNQEKVVEVPIQELLGSASEDIARPGRFQPSKLQRATEFLRTARSVDIPEVSIRGGKTIIEDGLHRLQAAAAAGETTVPVRVPIAQGSRLLSAVGKAGQAASRLGQITGGAFGGFGAFDIAEALGRVLNPGAVPTPAEADPQAREFLMRAGLPVGPGAQFGGSIQTALGLPVPPPGTPELLDLLFSRREPEGGAELGDVLGLR